MTRFAVDIVPDAESIARLNEDVSNFLDGAGVDARAVHHVALVLDELLTNLISHGHAGAARTAIVIKVEPDHVSGEIGDQGEPFDPRDAPPPDLTAPVEDRKVGGLGLHLVRQLTSALDYRRDGNQNWTAFCILRAQKP